MNTSKKILIIAIAGIMLLSTACSKPAEKTNAQVTPTQAQKQSVEAFGIVKATDIKDVNISIGAVVDKVLVKEGQRVKLDEELMVLNIKDYEQQLKTKQHELNIARLEVQKLKNQLKGDSAENSSDPAIQKTLSDLQFAESAYQKAMKEQAGQEALFKSGALSQHEYDEFVKNVESKKKDVEDLKHDLNITLKGNVEIYDSIAIQNEKVAEAQSDIDALREKLDKSYIKNISVVSDVANGIVYEIGYIPGDTIDSSKKLFSIMNLDTMVVEANVAEEFIKDVKIGAEVEITPLADKSKKYKGKVTRISGNAIVQNGETVIPVEVSIDNKDDFLLPNFNVDISIMQK